MTRWSAKARKRWPKAIWITGNGEYASVSYCPPDPTVMLFNTRMEAEIAKATIDSSACGGRCTRQHEIVFLGRGRGCGPIPKSEIIGEIKRRQK